MSRLQKILITLFISLFLFSLGGIVARKIYRGNLLSLKHSERKVKLYWFIPDGLRAEPDTFTIYKWAQEGRLPNLKKMMEKGVYGYSVPIFPGHTPANFATLFTGVLPKDHGVSDGPIRSFGYPLKMIPRSGFSSTAKAVDPLWYTLEQSGLISSLLTVPGSTPPELSQGSIIKGRWGGWGMDFPSVIFHSSLDRSFQKTMGLNDRAFNIGKRLTIFRSPKSSSGWPNNLPKTYSPSFEVNLNNWGQDLFALFLDENDDGVPAFTTVLLSKNKIDILATLHEGDWSEWLPADLVYEIQKSFQDEHPQKMKWEQEITNVKLRSFLRVKLIKVKGPEMFRLRVLYDGLNESVTLPTQLSEDLHQVIGPMVDYPDDYPPQLIYYPEDKTTFQDENKFSFEWHQKALKYIFEQLHQDVIIHNIYTPNQMLTSRWWMAFLDTQSARYGKATSEEKKSAIDDAIEMYQRIDNMLGEAMDHLDENAYFVFSSDHGVAPLNQEVRLNNLFAQKGWLKFKYDKDGVLRIDWDKTKVVFLQSYHIYINPQGLGGVYSPPQGEAYERLLQEVKYLVSHLRNQTGDYPFEHVYQRSEVESALGLPSDRVGDLVLVFKLGFCATEDMSEDFKIFQEPLKSGYKQGLDPQKNKSLWTPFVVMGPGIKKNHALKEPISHLDQYPIIMNLLKAPGAPQITKAEVIDMFTK